MSESCENISVDTLLSHLTLPSFCIYPHPDPVTQIGELYRQHGPLLIRTLNNHFCGVVNELHDIPLMYSSAQKYTPQDQPILIQPHIHGETYEVLMQKIGHRSEIQGIFHIEHLSTLYRIPVRVTIPPPIDPKTSLAITQTTEEIASKFPRGKYYLSIELCLTKMEKHISFIYATPHVEGYITKLLSLSKQNPDFAYCLSWLIPHHSGVVEKIGGIEQIKDMSNIEEVRINLQRGQYIPHVTNTTTRDKMGYIITKGKTPNEAIQTAKTTMQLVQISTKNVLL